jgi:hypothetical protein
MDTPPPPPAQPAHHQGDYAHHRHNTHQNSFRHTFSFPPLLNLLNLSVLQTLTRQASPPFFNEAVEFRFSVRFRAFFKSFTPDFRSAQ